MPDALNEKFNRLMPESEGPTLCYEISKPISVEGYEENFLIPARGLIAKYGEIRILNYFTSPIVWEEQAAIMDIGAHLEMGKYLKKIAFVNAPEKEIMARLIRTKLTSAEMRFFATAELKDAILWVKS